MRVENFVNTISQKTVKVDFTQSRATGVFGFIDVLIRFWGQMSKVKVTAGSDPETG